MVSQNGLEHIQSRDPYPAPSRDPSWRTQWNNREEYNRDRFASEASRFRLKEVFHAIQSPAALLKQHETKIVFTDATDPGFQSIADAAAEPATPSAAEAPKLSTSTGRTLRGEPRPSTFSESVVVYQGRREAGKLLRRKGVVIASLEATPSLPLV